MVSLPGFVVMILQALQQFILFQVFFIVISYLISYPLCFFNLLGQLFMTLFMRGSVLADQLLFNPEIERTACRLNRKIIRRRQLAKERREHEGNSVGTSSTTHIFTPVMEDPPEPPRGPCTNSPRRNAQFARIANNGRHSEMKTMIVQLLQANLFIRLDHEDPYTHLTKFYEIVGAIIALEAEEEHVFKRLFPLSFIGKEKEWYLDQPTKTITD